MNIYSLLIIYKGIEWIYYKTVYAVIETYSVEINFEIVFRHYFKMLKFQDKMLNYYQVYPKI